MGKKIVLFDGVCHLCQWTVQFIISHDPKSQFRFASLQSTVGKELRKQNGLDTDHLNSVVLIEDRRSSTGSTAALRIAKGLAFPWSLLYSLIIIPKWIREPIYRFIAKKRYAWFGKDEVCMIPSKEILSRFLD